MILAADIETRILAGATLVEQTLDLDFGGFSLRVRSNSEALLNRLQDYFRHIVCHLEETDATVVAINGTPPDLDLTFRDWKREPGKTGRKDAVADLADGRVIHKVRTGMVFLQSEQARVAAGPCLANDNQIINFINNQYMNRLQQQGSLNCHASAIVKDERMLAVAAFSGGGKSTLMLRLLEDPQTLFASNDRLFIRREDNTVKASGVPKLPRINPGTILHNPRLQHLITEPRRQELMQLPPAELWELEEKYDVPVEAIYGEGRIQAHASLAAFLVLNWQRESEQALEMKAIELSQRPDLLRAIMKTPGPFYIEKDGRLSEDDNRFDEQAYLSVLETVPVYEATGRVDFDELAERYLSLLAEIT